MENNRNTVVINAGYQYRLAAFAVSAVILATNILIIVGALAPRLVGFEFIITQKGSIVIAGVQLLLFISVWFISLRLAHRVAGPVFAFESALKRVERGDFTTNVTLRKKDEFKNLAGSINQAIDATNSKLLAAQQKVKFARSCSDPQEIQGALAELQEVLEEFTLTGKEQDEQK